MPDIIDLVPASHHDLLRSRSTATFTTIDGQGRPQSTAVWFLLDDDGRLKGSFTTARQKYRNLSANAACDLFIIDPANPTRTLEIRADAALEADPEYAMIAKFAKFAKAYGVDEAMLRAAAPGERFTVILQPWKVVANPPA